jgi:DNA-binding NarL/FixJ family response regulator
MPRLPPPGASIGHRTARSGCSRAVAGTRGAPPVAPTVDRPHTSASPRDSRKTSTQLAEQNDPLVVAPERRALLERAVAAATTPGGRLLLVGDPGIGKSHLVDAVLRAVDGDRTVLSTRALEADRRPFAGLRDLLAPLPDEAFRSLPVDQRAPVLAVLGRGPGRGGDGALVQAGVTRILADLARGGAMIVLDDWQWLDPETRRVLERALLRPGIGSALSVVAARRADGSAEDLAARPLFPSPDVASVAPLGTTSVRRIIAGVAPGVLPASTLAEVAEESGGNPLWAIELAAARADGDARPEATGSVVETATHRIGALPREVQQVLRLVAVLGSARVDDLGTAHPAAAEAVADGVARRVLRIHDGTVTVTHPLIAAAALHALAPHEERALHAAAAGLPLPAARRLEHRDAAATPGAHEELARELSSASDRLHRNGETETALRLARRSLVRTQHGSALRAGRVADAAELAFATGDAALAVEIAEELEVEDLPVPVLDRIITTLVPALDRTAGGGAVARRLDALQHGSEAGGTGWSIVEIWRIVAMHGRDEESVDGLLALAETLPPAEAPRTRAAALRRAARSRLERGYGVDDALVARIRAVERVSGAPTLDETADAMEALWPYQADDLARSRANLSAYIRTARATGERYATVQGLAHAAIVETLAGRLDAAGPLLDETARESRALPLLPPSLYRARALHALARDEREVLDDVRAGRMSPAAENRGLLLRTGVAGLDHAYSGRWDDALEDLERAHSTARSLDILEPGRRLWIDAELVRALVHAGDIERAAAITADLTALGGRPGRAHTRGQALRLRSLIAAHAGDTDEALRLSSDGLAALLRGGFQPEVLRARLEQIEILQRTGQVARARQVLEDAVTLAMRIGDPRLTARVEAVRFGLKAADGRDSLTPAELRVARAAAAGRMNREIAADLFLSVRTVETHLASIYRKVGVRTRTELALSLREDALAVPA